MNTSYRQILVHLDATAAVERRLSVALLLARQNSAALTALYAVTPEFLALPYAPELGSMLAADLAERDELRRAEVLKVFDEAVKGAGLTASWSQTSETPIIGAFAQQALYADLLVLGQYQRSDEAAGAVPADFVSTVLATSGRPAIVLPYAGPARTVGDTIAIAWRPGAEAARAVTAAMPLLERARQVDVLTWGDEDAPAVGGAPLDLASYLGAHGVQATWHHGGPEPDRLGERLLSRMFDLGAGLLVMGCYGHSRAREWILGGVTRTMLQAMTVPVLMSH